MNTLEKFEAKQLEKYQAEKQIPEFGPGDTVKVNVRVKEGSRERIQAYEGVCIARSGGNGLSATFTVRKISLGEGVERVFPLWSSRVDSIELVRRGSVRRAKLYYLRDRRGKSARISERIDGHGIEKDEDTDAKVSKTEKAKTKKSEKKAKKAENRKASEEAKAKAKAAKAAAKEAEKAENAPAEEAAPSEAPAEDNKAEE